jgi:GNAT superfamily N-acetyltransferase
VDLELLSVLDYGLDRTVELLNLGLSDYIVPIHLDLAAALHMTSHDSVDLSSSQVVLREGHAVGAALIARRGWTCRLAAMAVVPDARGAGVGGWLLARTIEQARERGERAMVLEVIEGNEAAERLYRRSGFSTVRRLVSYSASPASVQATGDGLGREVDVREVARWVSAYGLPGLPWQVSGESLAQLGPPNVAYNREGAYIVLSNPEADQVAVRSLLVLPEARGQGRGAELLRAAMACTPGKTWRVPPFCPEEMGGLFERVGFERGSLAQVQMRLEWG